MRRLFVFAATLCSFASLSPLAVAQTAGGSQPSSAKSQQGGSAPSPSQANSDASAKLQQKKTKKVWTNEEVGNLNGPVSVVGSSSAAAPRGTAVPSSATAGSADADRYRRQLAPLRSDLAEIDRQIREVKSMGSQGAAYNNTSLDKLQERRKAVQLKIDAIEDAARRHGIAPGDLR